MTPARQLALIGVVSLSLAGIVKAAQVSLTPESLAALALIGRAVIGNVVVQALFITAGFAVLLSFCVASWERSERRHAEHLARCAEWEAARRQSRGETSSLMDDSQTTDCGPRAA